MAWLQVEGKQLEFGIALGEVLRDVVEERKRQDEQWGGNEHDDPHTTHEWAAYIVKQIGRLVDTLDHEQAYERLIKIAALAVAAGEVIARARKRAYLERTDR